MITSAANPRVKLLRSLHERKHRLAHGLCLVEGIRLLEEALASGQRVEAILYTPERLSSTAAGRALLPRLERLPGAEQVDLPLLERLSDTITSQGVIAAVAIPKNRPFQRTGHVLVLGGIADPGNAGTMLRTARAAGAAGVAAMRSTTDLWGPKVLRAGMGAHFGLPLATDLAWPDLPATIGERQLLVASAHDGVPYSDIDWTRPSAILIGSEAHGSSAIPRDLPAQRVTIPMAQGVESLNAATAAAILLFAART